MAKKKKEEIFFIVSKTGRKKTRVNFYDKKGKSVSKDDLNIKYRNPNTGRFITERYSDKDKLTRKYTISRDAKTGQFIPVKDSKKKPKTTIVENSPLYFEKNKKK